MKFLARLGIITLLIVITLALSVSAKDMKASKITLVGRTAYLEVHFKVDKAQRILTMMVGDTLFNVGFDNIGAIYDDYGVDITQSVLGDGNSSGKPVESSSVAKPAWAERRPSNKSRPFNLAIQINGCGSLPVGTWFNGTKSSLGFGGDVCLPLSHNLALRGTVSKAGLAANKDELYVSLAYPYYGYTLVDYDVSFTVTRFFLSLEYMERPGRWRDSWSMWYFYSGLGAVNHRVSMSAIARTEEGELIQITGVPASMTKFALTNGAGVMLSVASHTALQFGLTSDILIIDRGDSSSSFWFLGYFQEAVIFDLQIGIVRFF